MHVDRKNPVPLGCPNCFYPSMKAFSGILNSARFFPSTVANKVPIITEVVLPNSDPKYDAIASAAAVRRHSWQKT